MYRLSVEPLSTSDRKQIDLAVALSVDVKRAIGRVSTNFKIYCCYSYSFYHGFIAHISMASAMDHVTGRNVRQNLSMFTVYLLQD